MVNVFIMFYICFMSYVCFALLYIFGLVSIVVSLVVLTFLLLCCWSFELLLFPWVPLFTVLVLLVVLIIFYGFSFPFLGPVRICICLHCFPGFRMVVRIPLLQL